MSLFKKSGALKLCCVTFATFASEAVQADQLARHEFNFSLYVSGKKEKRTFEINRKVHKEIFENLISEWSDVINAKISENEKKKITVLETVYDLDLPRIERNGTNLTTFCETEKANWESWGALDEIKKKTLINGFMAAARNDGLVFWSAEEIVSPMLLDTTQETMKSSLAMVTAVGNFRDAAGKLFPKSSIAQKVPKYYPEFKRVNVNDLYKELSQNIKAAENGKKMMCGIGGNLGYSYYLTKQLYMIGTIGIESDFSYDSITCGTAKDLGFVNEKLASAGFNDDIEKYIFLLKRGPQFCGTLGLGWLNKSHNFAIELMVTQKSRSYLFHHASFSAASKLLGQAYYRYRLNEDAPTEALDNILKDKFKSKSKMITSFGIQLNGKVFFGRHGVYAGVFVDKTVNYDDNKSVFKVKTGAVGIQAGWTYRLPFGKRF